ncbi:Protein CBG25774 [Caenorhabditis briggsae]|uniref:Protein CBG25774 n=1 Tax=Caenorhabditis briggsae TaxID=6238 RepID=B6IGJ7_CAEBR|nr:Protein CBG25774 [Caenorhabditis briggsae]CAR99027.1 Protein CBG25774 [Caenorhabditis briggsae]
MAAAAPAGQEREIPNLDWYLGLDEEDDIVIGDFIQRLMMNRDPRERIQIPHPRVFGELPRTAPRPAQPITNPFAPTPRQIRLRQEGKPVTTRRTIPTRRSSRRI